MKLAIIGAGAWGTALAVTFSSQHQVSLCLRDHAAADNLRSSRENVRYLPGIKLPSSVCIETDQHVVLADADLVLIATPLAGLRNALRAIKAIERELPVVWACKGLEAETAKLPHQIAEEELGAGAGVGALTGPSFADEVARGLPTAITLASPDRQFAQATAATLHHPRLRIYANDDVVGAEVGGAVKNVMAIAAGICDGMGYGLNARAALITRGLAEIARLGEALGGRRETFMGLAGMGDLILTCTGDLSRNRRVGLALARGEPLAAILQKLGHVAEGVNAAREVAVLARRLAVDMPITQGVAGILFDGLSPGAAVDQLLARDPKLE